MRGLKEPSCRFARWFLKLQMFDFDVKYRPGASVRMRGADSLSRLPEIVSFVAEDGFLSREMVKAKQRLEPKLVGIIEFLESNSSSILVFKSNQLRSLQKFSKLADDGLLLRYVGPRGKPWEHESMHFRVWLPHSLVPQVKVIFHDEKLSGHLGIGKTYLRIEERVYWE